MGALIKKVIKPSLKFGRSFFVLTFVHFQCASHIEEIFSNMLHLLMLCTLAISTMGVAAASVKKPYVHFVPENGSNNNPYAVGINKCETPLATRLLT